MVLTVNIRASLEVAGATETGEFDRLAQKAARRFLASRFDATWRSGVARRMGQLFATRVREAIYNQDIGGPPNSPLTVGTKSHATTAPLVRQLTGIRGGGSRVVLPMPIARLGHGRAGRKGPGGQMGFGFERAAPPAGQYQRWGKPATSYGSAKKLIHHGKLTHGVYVRGGGAGKAIVSFRGQASKSHPGAGERDLAQVAHVLEFGRKDQPVTRQMRRFFRWAALPGGLGWPIGFLKFKEGDTLSRPARPFFGPTLERTVPEFRQLITEAVMERLAEK